MTDPDRHDERPGGDDGNHADRTDLPPAGALTDASDDADDAGAPAVPEASPDRPAGRSGTDRDRPDTADDYETVDVSVLVVGAGAAGARAAIAAVESGLDPEDVLVIGKRDHGDAHTTWARGGINGALGTHDPEDDWTIHAADTLKEGHHLNDPAMVEAMTREMPALLRELDDWGMAFSRTPEGEIDQRYFGAQSFRRTAFAGDHTGESLMDTLVDRAQSLSIPYRENVYVSRLLTDGPAVDAGGAAGAADGPDDAPTDRGSGGSGSVSSRVLGAAAHDLETGEFVLFDADVVVLAAGGYTSLYDRHSSRDDENTGDGPALAYEAGASLVDAEFVQFHPTGMVGDRYGEEWDGRLVTEAVRGEGGRLFNADGERFMEQYSPDQMELDARDVVARAIDAEIAAGRGTENGGVYLDVSHRDRSFIKERLPRMYERFEELGVDLATDPVEVAPTAHYGMGGVEVDDVGQTAVDGLYAVGETAAGVHGANRLGGNSLAETIAFGKRTGEVVAGRLADGRDAGDSTATADDSDASAVRRRAQRHFADLAALADGDGRHDPEALFEELRSTLGGAAGIHRTDADLARGLARVDEIRDRATDLAVGDRTSRSFEFALNLGFALDVAEAVLRGARERTESRGAHHRTDHPATDPDWRRNVRVTRDSVGAMRLETVPVGTPSEAVQRALDADHELDYHQLE